MSVRKNNLYRLAVNGLVLAVALVGAAAVSSTPAVAGGDGSTNPGIDPAVLGSTAATAAGSCWEIKQARSSAASDTYWLLTPAMSEPTRFYCDMTTDGGGWVLVGKGRNGWTPNYDGKGAQKALLDPGYSGGGDTHQLPSQLIDQLLDGGRVADLSDGVRLRRATNSAGSSWQEARFRLSKRDRWVWSFASGHPLTNYTFDGTTRSGGSSDSFGSDNSYRRVITTSRSSTGYNFGFGYGSGVGGSSATGSYLYSPSGGGEALPVTQVYLRPRVLSTAAGFATIPDDGTGAIRQAAQPESNADTLPWGVTGLAGSTQREGNVEVQAFTQSGKRMYVGGNFRYVQRDENGADRVEQPFLAAFDVDTGAWVSSFRPSLNEQVRALATLPDGRVVAGGEFSAANGAPATGVVALDPVTGQTAGDWSLTVENRTNAGVVSVRALEVDGDELYLAGSFTHLTGGSKAWPHYMRNLARVSAADGTPVVGWNPEFNGTVMAVDAAADHSRMYAAGYFTRARGGVQATSAAAVQTATGADLATPAWHPVWSSSNNYQQGIAEARDRVWVGGSEHNLFSFSTSSFQRLGTDIFNPKGDVQAIQAAGDVVYAGCHCNSTSYSGATNWPDVGSGWHQADAINWVGAWDARTGDRVPGFTPQLKMRLGSGVWAIAADSNGRIWVGGDIVKAATKQKAGAWAGGFTRFTQRDVGVPDTPGDLRLVDRGDDSVTLAWNKVTDASGVRYQVLHDDRPVAVTTDTRLELPGAGGRYAVRAADGAGNVSASTPALVVATEAPQTLVAGDASWRWTYPTEAPPAEWSQSDFDDTAWDRGGAVLGWGSSSVVTEIDSYATTAERPRAAYFRHAFELEDPDALDTVVLTGVANDGAVVYVNGVEVARQNMPDGAITHLTYAPSARREAVAKATPLVVEVPRGLLRAGTNVIAAETHVNYRGTPDLTFELKAVATLR